MITLITCLCESGEFDESCESSETGESGEFGKSGEKGESGNQVNWVSPITAITSVKSSKCIFSYQSHIRKVSAYSVTNIALRVNYGDYGASVLQGEQYFTASLPHLSSGAATTHPDASMIQPRWLH